MASLLVQLATRERALFAEDHASAHDTEHTRQNSGRGTFISVSTCWGVCTERFQDGHERLQHFTPDTRYLWKTSDRLSAVFALKGHRADPRGRQSATRPAEGTGCAGRSGHEPRRALGGVPAWLPRPRPASDVSVRTDRLRHTDSLAHTNSCSPNCFRSPRDGGGGLYEALFKQKKPPMGCHPRGPALSAGRKASCPSWGHADGRRRQALSSRLGFKSLVLG